MFRSRNTLLGSVLWKVLPISMVVLTAIWMVVINVTERSLEEESFNRIVQKTDALVLATDAQISNILAAVRNLSNTSLIINALIYDENSTEDEGEEDDHSYMGAFFRSLKVAGLQQATLKVLDYKGRVIVGSEQVDYQDNPWVKRVMEGKEYLFIDPNSRNLTFATPIEYNGSPEGILLLEVERRVLLEYLGEQLPMEAVLLRTHDHAVLYSALWGVDDEISYVDLPGTNPDVIEYQSTLRIFPAMTLRYSEDRTEAFAALEKLHDSLRIVLVLVLFALMVGIVLAGRAIVRPVQGFTEQLEQQRINPQQELELTLSGVAEVDQLADTYNQMQSVTRSLNRELRMQYQMMNQVFSSMEDGLVVFDDQHRIVEVNPAAALFFGEESDALMGAIIDDFIAVEQGDEVTIRSRAGDEVPVLRSYSMSQNQRYIIWVLHDLRERIKAEQQEQYGAFQAGIAEMGASVLHNIGNAITGMVGHVANMRKQLEMVGRLAILLSEQGKKSELLRQELSEEGEEECARLVQVMQQSGSVLGKVTGEQGVVGYMDRLSHAIQHVGEVISIQQSASRPVIHATRFMLQAMMDDTLGLIHDALQKRRILISMELSPDIPPLFLPRNPMIQLLLNLMKNSMEAIVEQMHQEPELSGRIVVQARLLDQEWFEITVADNGCGLEPERQDEIFQSHFSTKQRGSGYGLHSAGNFVASLGGEIQLESEGRGSGALMRMRLPLMMEEDEEE